MVKLLWFYSLFKISFMSHIDLENHVFSVLLILIEDAHIPLRTSCNSINPLTFHLVRSRALMSRCKGFLHVEAKAPRGYLK